MAAAGAFLHDFCYTTAISTNGHHNCMSLPAPQRYLFCCTMSSMTRLDKELLFNGRRSSSTIQQNVQAFSDVFIQLLAGVVILGVAVRWRQVLNAQIALLDSQQEEVEALDMFYICLIASGAVMMVVSFLGCYAVLQESQCFLGTPQCLLQFLACLVLLFACGVAAGIWGYMNKDELLRETTNFYCMTPSTTGS
uniref:Uncharacterized protein n=1 Tax=Knipowitschia caucasica TaxID=637954 RepID=A0AAV2LSL5_KNICA